MTREASTFRAHPLLERRHQRRDPDLSYGEPLFRGQTVDLALDIEDASIRRTASIASGAFATSASTNSLRRPCASTPLR